MRSFDVKPGLVYEDIVKYGAMWLVVEVIQTRTTFSGNFLELKELTLTGSQAGRFDTVKLLVNDDGTIGGYHVVKAEGE